jgi:hypothetical protein
MHVQEGMKIPMDTSAGCFNPYTNPLVLDNRTVISSVLPEWPKLKGCIPQQVRCAAHAAHVAACLAPVQGLGMAGKQAFSHRMLHLHAYSSRPAAAIAFCAGLGATKPTSLCPRHTAARLCRPSARPRGSS